MALSPTDFIDPADLPPVDLVAEATSNIEEAVDAKLSKQDFDRIVNYKESDYNWPQLNKQLKKTKRSVAYVLDLFYGDINLAQYEERVAQAACKRVRRMYQSAGWENILFYTEHGTLTNIALVKKGK